MSEVQFSKTALDRFVRLTKKCGSGCIEWQAAKYSNGYGKFTARSYRAVLAHRAAYALFVGPIPDGLWVLHRCDNPACVNPSHLFIGTHSDNQNDMHSKGRGHKKHVRGERHPSAKLTDEDVRAIRADRSAGKAKKALARQHGVTPRVITLIDRRVTWRHVT